MLLIGLAYSTSAVYYFGRESQMKMPTESIAQGGREWDVRMVKPRGLTGTDGDKKTTNSDADDEESPKQRFGEGDDVEYALTETAYCDETQTPATKDGGWQMVCRSKVGERIVGGGFLGVWKKMKK